MARDTDRKKISEAVRLQGNWVIESRGTFSYKPGRYLNLVKLSTGQLMHLNYSEAGQLTKVYRGHREPILAGRLIRTGKRDHVLAVLKGEIP